MRGVIVHVQWAYRFERSLWIAQQVYQDGNKYASISLTAAIVYKILQI